MSIFGRSLHKIEARILHPLVRKTTHGIRPYKKTKETPLLRNLRAKIESTGPLTVADYMKEVLQNPVLGYYMNRDVFGKHGDFITSPEISQMFGELIAVWCIYQWLQMGSPRGLQIVEFGPGRGTLADDMLRVFTKFPEAREGLSFHLIEVSPKLSELQELKLCGNQNVLSNVNNSSAMAYRHNISRHGTQVFWHKTLADVPKRFSCYIAHEFFDVLPAHKFQKTDRGYREVLIDIDDGPGPHHLRFVLAKGETAASKFYIDKSEMRDDVEVSPETGVLVEEITTRIVENGGCALIADYGHDGDKTDTLRAFRNHSLFDVLCEPGSADVTTDVDFRYIRKIAQKTALSFGPIPQRRFLQNMAIETRLEKLLRNCTADQIADLTSGYDMLVNPDKMGERFKFLSIFPPTMEDIFNKHLPAGFHDV